MKQLLYAIVVIFLVLVAGCIAPITDAPTATTPVTRRVTHALGESEVPADPQRVVVLAAMDNVLALGITPVGATGEQAAFPLYLDAATLTDIARLGDNKIPNHERIVALQPDLIVGRTTRYEAIYPELSAIAPTVMIDQDGVGGWRSQFLAYADALNRTTEAEALLAAYDARAADIAQRLAALDPTVSLVRSKQISKFLQEPGNGG